MAAAGLLALLDDITVLLDDIALLSKVAAKKTAGVVGDDLALNAEQVSGIAAKRELPVVWAVTKGSLRNKLILVPLALAFSYFAPWLISPLLILGGLYLSYEGVEKIVHALFQQKIADSELASAALVRVHMSPGEIMDYEKDKIRGAIRTDFILSAEIIIIALGVVQGAALLQQIVVVSIIALAITLVVYGLVAVIVRLDDMGLALLRPSGVNLGHKIQDLLGKSLLWGCPYLLRGLSLVGTAAMFLVGGGILVHYAPGVHPVAEQVLHFLGGTGIPLGLLEVVLNMLVGLLAGAVLCSVAKIVERFR